MPTIGRRLPVRGLALAAAAGLLVSACSTGVQQVMPVPGPAEPAAVPVMAAADSAAVVPSEVYAAAVGAAAQQRRLQELTRIVERLRADSTSGWQAVQADGTGFAQEVAGGRLAFTGSPVDAVTEFLASYGELFGPASGFTYEVREGQAPGFVTVRVEQAVDGVPVDGALLVASVREREGRSEVQSVSGSVVDTSGVSATPAISAPQAESIASTALGAPANPGAALVVTSGGTGPRLAWAVTVPTGPDTGEDAILGLAVQYPALVFVDAQDGSVLGMRVAGTNPSGRMPTASSAGPQVDYGNYDFEIPPGGRPVVISTDYLGLIPIKVNAQQLPDGSLVMVDLTGPGADARTKKGAIVVLDGAGTGGDVGSARLVRYPDARSIPTDALYAMWGVRSTLDYLYRELGQLSFDGQNSPVPIVINYTEGAPCMDNAFFLTAPGQSHMAVGIACPDDQGNRLPTLADIDTMAHEIGHGVLHSHTFERQSIQQGAIDEGTADYLGAALRNGVLSSASPVSSADICRDFAGRHPWCLTWADGVGIRSLNTGATFDDYAFTLDGPFEGTLLKQVFADSGHTNSMVWTNALWQARKAVASMDGGDMVTSARAREFDRAVFRAGTRFAPGTDFVQASEEVVRSAEELGMTAQEISLIRDRFRAQGICRGCQSSAGNRPGLTPVTVSTSVKSAPTAVGSQVAYLLGARETLPQAVVATPGKAKVQQLGPPATVSFTLAAGGGRVLQTQATLDADGSGTGALGWADPRTRDYGVVTDDVDVWVAPAVSADGMAWVDTEGSVVFEALDTSERSVLESDVPVAQVATSGDRVAVLTADGTLWVWTVATEQLRKLAVLNPAPLDSFRPEGLLFPLGSLAMSGDRVAVVGTTARPGPVLVYDLAANTKTTYSRNAVPLGVAVNDRLVVWVESRGVQDSPIYGQDAGAYKFPDTELRGYSFDSRQQYRMVDLRGQQGFPSLSDTQLAWQESANGNSDIYSVPIGSR